MTTAQKIKYQLDTEIDQYISKCQEGSYSKEIETFLVNEVIPRLSRMNTIIKKHLEDVNTSSSD